MNLHRITLLFVMILFGAFAAAQDTLIITNQSTGLNQEIAYEDIITVQPDGNNDRAKIIVGPSYSTIISLETYDDVINYENCRLLPFVNRISGLRTAVPYAHVDTVLNTGASGGATINASEDRFGYASTFSTVEKYSQIFSQYYECDQIAGRAVYEVVNVGYGADVGKGVVDGKMQLKTIVAGNGVIIDERSTTIVINSTGGGEGGGATDLSVVQGANSATISSSTGDDAPLLPVNSVRAGLMLPSQNDKLEGVEAGATGDQTSTEIVTAVNIELGSTDWQTGGSTDLTYQAAVNAGLVISSSGDDVTIPSVSTTEAGLMLPGQNNKLDGIESGATTDQTPAELVTGINTALGNTDWQSGGGGVSNTDLTYTPSANQGVVTSSSGDDATIPIVNGSNAGLMIPGDKTKLDGVEPGSTADQTPAELVAGINTSLGNTDWQTPGAGVTDLTYTPSATTGTVTSSTGDNATVPVVNGSNSGLMIPGDKTKLDGIESGATADLTPLEIESLLDVYYGDTLWRTQSEGGAARFYEEPTAIGAAEIKTVRIGGDTTQFQGDATNGYDIILRADTEITQLDFYGDNTTSNASGELVLKIDNSANSEDRFFMVDIFDLSSNQQLDVFAFGLIPTTTVSGNVTTLVIPNIAGNFPSGFRLILR